jgi:hypothetical protein
MTVEHAVQTASLGYQVFQDFYDSNIRYFDVNGAQLPRLSEWITYNTVYETVTLYADDWDAYTGKYLDVHFFTKDKSTANAVKIKLRNALRKEGYVIQQTQCSYESDTLYYHLIISVYDNDNTEVT